jgi:hypothetical protein
MLFLIHRIVFDRCTGIRYGMVKPETSLTRRDHIASRPTSAMADAEVIEAAYDVSQDASGETVRAPGNARIARS